MRKPRKVNWQRIKDREEDKLIRRIDNKRRRSNEKQRSNKVL